MEAIINFLNEYGILASFITIISGAIAAFARWTYKQTIGKKIDEETKEKIAKVVVKYTEQVWSDLHGEEKLEKALEAFSDMLNAKGITISELEMRVYLEAALAEFNKVFNKKTSEDI